MTEHDPGHSDDVSVVANQDEGRFELRLGDEIAGFASYRVRGSKVSITHTEIDQRFEGQGLGSRFVQQLLDQLRADGTGLLPFCPFVRGYVARHPTYLDLVAAEDRERFHLPLA